MNAAEEFKMYVAFKKNPHVVLNDQLDFRSD